jgi:aryl-alcohol dehydrogenase-like predicted oxidoreductase
VIYNVFDPTPERQLFRAAAEHDVAVIVRVSLDEGSLGGRLTRTTKFEQNDMRARYFRGERLAETVEHVERLRPVLEQKDQTMAQGALRFCLSAADVTTVIVGSVNPGHIRANAAVSDRGPLDASTLEQLHDHAWPRNYYH